MSLSKAQLKLGISLKVCSDSHSKLYTPFFTIWSWWYPKDWPKYIPSSPIWPSHFSNSLRNCWSTETSPDSL